MIPEMEALAWRAMACPGWRQMKGMRGFRGRAAVRVVSLPDPFNAGNLGLVFDGEEIDRYVAGWLPDLADPATLGCLLSLVREAWGRPDASVVQRTGTGGDSYWILALPAPPRPFPPPTGDTEAEALVAALEAAPAREIKP